MGKKGDTYFIGRQYRRLVIQPKVASKEFFVKYLKSIISSTGHEFDFMTVQSNKIFLIHKRTAYVYTCTQGERCIRNELYEIVNILGEIKKEVADEILKHNSSN